MISTFTCILVLTKTRNGLKRPETTYNDLSKHKATWNDLQRSTTSKKRHETTCNEQETTLSNLQRARNDLKQPTMSKAQLTMTWIYLKRAKKRRETTNSKQISRLWDKRFSSLARFPPKIWLQYFEYCFTENHGENRASSIYYYASSVSYHTYFFQDIRFIYLFIFFVWVSCQQGKGRLFFSSSPSTSTCFRKSFAL